MRKPTTHEKVICPADDTNLKRVPEKVWEVREKDKPVILYGVLTAHTHDMIQTGFYGNIPNPNGEPCEWAGLPVEVVS